MEEIFALLEGFDLNNFIPKLDTVLGQVEFWVRTAVMVAPLVLLGLGLWYLLLPPKEANHYVGFRTFWGMSSVAAWRFTQKVAGLLWSALGLILTLIMFLISAGFRGMEIIDMLWTGMNCLMWQAGCVLVSILLVNVAVIVFFDFKGKPRNLFKTKK